MDNFSEDEITYEMNRKIMKGKKDRVALQKARKLEGHLKDIKMYSVHSMTSILDTIKSIDENSSEIEESTVYKL